MSFHTSFCSRYLVLALDLTSPLKLIFLLFHNNNQKRQQSMWQFLGRGTNLIRNITYFVAYLAYGLYKIALGPLIPYLSEESGIIQTQYSFLFVCRAVGMLAGSALLHKYQNWPSRPSRHKMLAFSLAVIIATNFFFLWSQTPFFQGFWIFITSVHFFFIELLIDLCIISLGKNIEQLFLLTTASFGIGSLVSPMLVRMLGRNSFSVFAILTSALVPLVLYLPSPEISQGENQIQVPEKKLTLNGKTVNLLCVGFFTYIGLLIIKLAWSSSFAVIACDMTKQQATIFPALFSAFNIGTKFVWFFIPISGGRRLLITTKMLMIASILSMVPTQLGWPRQALYFDSIALGIFISPITSIIYSIGSQYGRPLTENQTRKLMTWGVIGEGILTLLCGNLMNIDINVYYYLSVIICFSIWLASRSLISELQSERINNPEKDMLEMQLIK